MSDNYSLPAINVSPSRSTSSRDKPLTPVRSSGERLSTSVTKTPLLRRSENSNSGGGILNYLSPQEELFSHYDSPNTHSRDLSPAFICGKAKEPENVYVLSPRGDLKPDHRPHSQTFLAGHAGGYDDAFVLTPGDKPIETRPHSPSFLSGAIKNPAKDDFFVLSPRDASFQQPTISNMRVGLSLPHEDSFMLEPNPPIALTRPHSPSFLSGAIPNPAKDDFFVLSPRDLSRLKAKEDSPPSGPGMRLGGALEHKDDSFLLEPNAPSSFTRPQSDSFLCGQAKAPTDEFVLTPSGDVKPDVRSSGMKAGGPLTYDDQFGHGDPYRAAVSLSDRPAGGMRVGRKAPSEEAPASRDPYIPEGEGEEGRGGGFFSAGVITDDNAINNYTPNEYPVSTDTRRLSAISAPKMNVGPINRTGDFVYVSEPEPSPEQTKRVGSRGLNMSGLRRDEDQFILATESGPPAPNYDRKTPYFSHKKIKKRSEVSSEPPVVKRGMKIAKVVSHHDDFVFKGGGILFEKGRQGSSLTTRGKTVTDDTMEKYESPGVPPMPTGKNEVRGMKVGVDFPHHCDGFVVHGGVSVLDKGRQGGGLKTGGKADIDDDTMGRYECQEEPEKVPGAKDVPLGMKVSKAFPHDSDIFALGGNIPKETPFRPDTKKQAVAGDAVSVSKPSLTSKPKVYESPYKQIPHPKSAPKHVNDLYQAEALKTLGTIKHKDEYCSEYDEVSKSTRDLRPQSDSFLAGELHREKDALFLEPAERVADISPASQPFSTCRENKDIFALKYDENAANPKMLARPYSSPYTVTTSMKRDDEFFLEPNKMGKNVTRAATHAFLAGAVSYTEDIFPFKYEPPPKYIEEESSFCCRHTSDSVCAAPFVYDLEYYITPPTESSSDLEAFKTLGTIKHKDEYCSEYDEVSKATRDLRPQSDSFLAGELHREKDALFLEPTERIADISRGFSQPFSTYGRQPMSTDIFALKYDENAAKPNIALRPHSSPYLVTSNIKRDDGFLLEPNKSTTNITRSSSTHSTKGSFVAGSARYQREDYYIRDVYQPKPSIGRSHSSSFLTSIRVPSKDIYFTEPTEKPVPRPVTANTTRAAAATEGSTTSTEQEELLVDMLSGVMLPKVPEEDDTAAETLPPSSEGIEDVVTAPESEQQGTENENGEPPRQIQAEADEKNDDGGPETEDDTSSLSSVDHIKQLVMQQKREWQLKTGHPDVTARKVVKPPPPKPKKVHICKAKQSQDKALALVKLKAMEKEERKNQVLVGKVTNLLSEVLQQSGKK
jgi:hypothetical protein